jgi:uncharacterized membrane protein YhhN
MVASTTTVGLLRHILPGVSPALKRPVLAYGCAVTGMFVAGSTVLAGPWPIDIGAAVFAGALFFYCGDAALALNRFAKPIPSGQAVSLALYWSGQFGIALAARWVSERGLSR